MMTKTNRLDKIRALLAKAEGTNHPPEAQAFTAKAHDLMIQWGIEDAELQAAGRKAEDTGSIGVTRVWMPYSPYQTPHIWLLTGIAKAVDCRTVKYTGAVRKNTKGSYDKGSWMHIIGFERDRDFTEAMYTSLMLQAESEFQSDAVQEQMFAETSHPGHRIRWRNAFMAAFARRVNTRMWEARKGARDEVAESTALVLRDRKTAVDNWVDDNVGPLSKGARSGMGGGAGSLAGDRAGRKADIGSAKVGGGKRQIGGGS